MDLTVQEKIDRVKEFRPIDDVFFEVLAENREVCEEILQTILEDKNLRVIDNFTQRSERNIYERSVRLDALCILGDGTKCNIEVQRSDNDNHLKRARFNASSVTVKDSNTGDDLNKVIDLYIVYISEFDFLSEGKTIYHIDKTIRETGTVVDDGLHEIFVNTVVDDNSDIAALISCFTEKQVDNPKFPKLSSEVKRLKTTEGGASAVCEIMERYKEEAVKEAEERGRIYELIKTARKYKIEEKDLYHDLMSDFQLTKEEAYEEIKKYDESLLQKV